MISYTENIDCKLAMATYTDKFFDVAVVDPPYFEGFSKVGYFGEKHSSKLNIPRGQYEIPEWDDQIPDQTYLDELVRVSKHQIIFGINYFTFFHAPGRIVWDKVNDNSPISNCEIASCSFHDSVRIFRYLWNGMLQGDGLGNPTRARGNKKKNEKRIHPTQKPIDLYRWIFSRYCKPGDKILDTHLGSGSSRIAADMAGNLDFYGYEISPKVFDDQEKRFAKYKSQLKLSLK